MTRMCSARLLVVMLSLTAAICAYSQSNVSPTAAEDAVRKADAAWAKAVESKSVDRTVAFYAPDAVTAGSAMFPAHGLEEFRAAWASAFSESSFALTWKAESVVITDNGSIAYSSGTWNDGKQHGPYLAVWQKQPSGQWKIVIDSAWYMP